MNIRPLFWMTVGAGATLISGAWGEKQFMPIAGDLYRTVPEKSAILQGVSVNISADLVAGNLLRRTPWVKPKADPFGERPVVVPRAIAPVVENHEPPPLVFPYEYVGKLTEDGKETLFFSKGDQIYQAAEGETVENLYRVEHVRGDSIELSYLPDARKMTIALESMVARHDTAAIITSYPEMAPLPPPPPMPTEAEVMQMMSSPPATPAPTEDEPQLPTTSDTPPQPPLMPSEIMPPEISPPGMSSPEITPPPEMVPSPEMAPPGMIQQGAPQ